MNLKTKNKIYIVLPLVFFNVVLGFNLLFKHEAKMAIEDKFNAIVNLKLMEKKGTAEFNEKYEDGSKIYCNDKYNESNENVMYPYPDKMLYTESLGCDENCNTTNDGKVLFEYYGINAKCWVESLGVGAGDRKAKECLEKFTYGGIGTMYVGDNLVVNNANGLYVSGSDASGRHWLMSSKEEPYGNAMSLIKNTNSVEFGNNLIVKGDVFLKNAVFQAEAQDQCLQYAEPRIRVWGYADPNGSIKISESSRGTLDTLRSFMFGDSSCRGYDSSSGASGLTLTEYPGESLYIERGDQKVYLKDEAYNYYQIIAKNGVSVDGVIRFDGEFMLGRELDHAGSSYNNYKIYYKNTDIYNIRKDFKSCVTGRTPECVKASAQPLLRDEEYLAFYVDDYCSSANNIYDVPKYCADLNLFDKDTCKEPQKYVPCPKGYKNMCDTRHNQ